MNDYIEKERESYSFLNLVISVRKRIAHKKER